MVKFYCNGPFEELMLIDTSNRITLGKNSTKMALTVLKILMMYLLRDLI